MSSDPHPVDANDIDRSGIDGAGSSHETPLDLDHCAREPIHIPGAIQSAGYLIAVDEDLRIGHVSTNIGDLLGTRPGTILGRDLGDVIGAAATDLVAEARVRAGRLTRTSTIGIGDRDVEVRAHVSPAGMVVVEIEPVADAPVATAERIEMEADRVLDESEFDAAGARFCESVRRLTGFGRVLLYRFDEDWSGETVAESAAPEMEHYLGLRFPASDIPEQARQLYASAPIRVIFDAQADPSPLLAARPNDGPIDLSRSTLRACSPMHLRYLANMNVRSSMSISIMHGDRLWGLAACHSSDVRPVSGATRRSVAVLARLVSEHLLRLDPQIGVSAESAAFERFEDLVDALPGREDLFELLADPERGIKSLFPCGGLVIRLGGRIRTAGEVPGDADVIGLLDYVHESLQGEIFETDRLSEKWPPAAALSGVAAGALAIRLGRATSDIAVWLRPEYSRVVRWAGDPRKPAVWDDEGVSRLQPRQSFESWKEEVRLRSEPWRAWHRRVASRLQSVLVNVVGRAIGVERESGRARRAERDLAVAKHDLVRQRRAILAMLADAADAEGSPTRLHDVVSGLGSMVDRLAASVGHHDDLTAIERDLTALESGIGRGRIPGSTELRDIRDRLRTLLEDLDVSSPIVETERPASGTPVTEEPLD